MWSVVIEILAPSSSESCVADYFQGTSNYFRYMVHGELDIRGSPLLIYIVWPTLDNEISFIGRVLLFC